MYFIQQGGKYVKDTIIGTLHLDQGILDQLTTNVLLSENWTTFQIIEVFKNLTLKNPVSDVSGYWASDIQIPTVMYCSAEVVLIWKYTISQG